MRSRAPWLLLLLAVLACDGDDAPVDQRRDLFEKARTTLEQARGRFVGGDLEGARRDLLRGEEQALGALRAPGSQPKAEILNLISNICVEIGMMNRPYLVRALRFADRALDEAPGWPLPYFNLGLSIGGMGHFLDAVNAYDHVLQSDLPPEVRIPAAGNKAGMLLSEARVALLRGRPGAHAVARYLVEQAYALRVEFGSIPEVDQTLSELGRFYEQATREAIAAGDPAALAVAHAECGYFEPANEILTRARNESGRTEDLRWAEVRFVEELASTPESLASAEKHYLEFIGRGERVVQALAGYGRVCLALGRPDDALKRIEGFPEPSVEMREVHVRILLAQLEALPRDSAAEAEDRYKRIDALLLGSFSEEDRSTLMIEAMKTAVRRGDADRLERWLGQFQLRYPQDARSLLFEGRLLQLRKVPLLPEDETPAGAAPAGGKAGNG